MSAPRDLHDRWLPKLLQPLAHLHDRTVTCRSPRLWLMGTAGWAAVRRCAARPSRSSRSPRPGARERHVAAPGWPATSGPARRPRTAACRPRSSSRPRSLAPRSTTAAVTRAPGAPRAGASQGRRALSGSRPSTAGQGPPHLLHGHPGTGLSITATERQGDGPQCSAPWPSDDRARPRRLLAPGGPARAPRPARPVSPTVPRRLVDDLHARVHAHVARPRAGARPRRDAPSTCWSSAPGQPRARATARRSAARAAPHSPPGSTPTPDPPRLDPDLAASGRRGRGRLRRDPDAATRVGQPRRRRGAPPADGGCPSRPRPVVFISLDDTLGETECETWIGTSRPPLD